MLFWARRKGYPKLRSQNVLCYHGPSVPGNCKTMHCGILLNSSCWRVDTKSNFIILMLHWLKFVFGIPQYISLWWFHFTLNINCSFSISMKMFIAIPTPFTCQPHQAVLAPKGKAYFNWSYIIFFSYIMVELWLQLDVSSSQSCLSKDLHILATFHLCRYERRLRHCCSLSYDVSARRVGGISYRSGLPSCLTS